MELDFKLTDKEGLDCFAGCMVSILEWKGMDCSILFRNAWEFNFAENFKQHFLKDLIREPEIIDYNILRIIFGITIHYKEYVDKDNIINIIKEQVEKNLPVIVIHDMYWCPWLKSFQFRHAPEHGSIVIGYDDSNFICSDYVPKCNRGVLPYEYIGKSFKGMFILKIDSNSVMKNIDFNKIMSSIIESVIFKNVFAEIRRFGNYIKNDFDPISEFNQYGESDFGISNPVNWIIERIAYSRYYFTQALSAINKELKTDYLPVSINKLLDAKEQWLVIRAAIMECCISRKSSKLTHISELIINLANFEENIFYGLQKNFNIAIDI